MYKVFINDSALVITDTASSKGIEYQGLSHVQSLIEKLEDQETQEIVISAERPGEVWRDFKSLYRIIEAAGGVVFNPDDEILMIYRLERWDLPKGKIEKEESPASAAVREVEEECGISAPEVIRQLQETYHTYPLKGEKILKRTYWFLMEHDGEEDLSPQQEESIAEARWCSKDEARERLENTYGNIRDLLWPFV